MRLTTGLLAEVKGPSGVKFLNVGAPTGLTGIHTHRSPRPHLLYLYHQTLQKLASLPEISVYRQSTEALTRHRLKAVEAAIPEGVDAWRSRVTKHLDEHAGRTKRLVEQMLTGKGYPPQAIRTADDRDVEWNDDVGEERAEGPRNLEAQGKNQARDFGVGMEVEEQTKQHPQVEDEPPLSADQVSALENTIGSGLIEEVINVAEGELELVDHMKEAQIWEELEERPQPGQWDYFQRDRNTGQTQAP